MSFTADLKLQCNCLPGKELSRSTSDPYNRLYTCSDWLKHINKCKSSFVILYFRKSFKAHTDYSKTCENRHDQTVTLTIEHNL